MDDCSLVALVALLHDGKRILPRETIDRYLVSLQRLGQNGQKARSLFDSLAAPTPPPNDTPLASLIARAEAFAADGNTACPSIADIAPLLSPFSHVRLTASTEPPQSTTPMAHLMATAPGVAYPVETPIASYVQGFARSLERVAATVTSMDGLFVHTLAEIERYGWCLPVHDCNTSFAEHARFTSALAACLCRQEQAEGDALTGFGLLVGDISGIQDYLYDIANIGPGGVARRLRSRSFFISLISDVLGHSVLRAFGLPLSCLLMSSGGKFYVLVPWTEETDSTCRRLQSRADEWMLNTFQGVLSANLAWMHCEGSAFAASTGSRHGFGDTISDLLDHLAQRKQRRLENALQSAGEWRSDRFVLPAEYPHGECKSCHRFPASAWSDPSADRQTIEPDVCTWCDQDARLGSLLPRARYIAYYANDAGQMKLMPGASVTIADTIDKVVGNPYLVTKINDPDRSELAAYPATFRYLANHIPRFGPQCGDCPGHAPLCSVRDQYRQGDPLQFECIAAHADGRPMLGYLKADVDRLGKIFAFGLKREGDVCQYDSAVQIMMLSRAVDLFFTSRMETMISKDYPYCYTVYAGGDDLLIIGPWDQAVALAIRVEESFHSYVGNNPDVTLSAGIAFVKDRLPVFRATEYAEESLKEAKTRGRNRASMLGLNVPWPDVRAALDQAKALRTDAERGATSALLFNLMEFADMYERYAAGDSVSIRYQALLAYTVGRTLKNQSPQIQKWASTLVEAVLKRESDQRKLMDELGFLARYLILAKRKRQENK